MNDTHIAPYGSWSSPITAARVAAGVRPVGSPRIHGDGIAWLQGQPEQDGRQAIVKANGGDRDGVVRVVTPAPFNVRTRVHEYGGGAYAAAGDMLWFSNFGDNLVYAQQGEAPAVAITTDSLQRHADFEPDTTHRRLLAVREHHAACDARAEPVNSIVALPMDGGASTSLVAGADFYAAPRVSPDGRRLAWLTWNHPRMPWQGTELWIARIADDGTLSDAQRTAGGPDESLCQPAWSPDGKLYVVSDRSGYWNLYRVEVDGLVAVCPMAAEFGVAQWTFAQSTYGFINRDEIVAAVRENARGRLLRIDLRSGVATPIVSTYEDFAEVRAGTGFVVLEAGSPSATTRIVRLSFGDDGAAVETVLAASTDEHPDDSVISIARAISYPSENGRTAHAFHYAPRNAAYEAPATERPPLIVISHGGPTSMSTNTLKLATQFWTSRGFAVLDVNYGGSTGFGRAYRELLTGRWGVVDVEDCVAGARYLAAQGLVDANRLAIRGGSAGGFTTLAALAFHDVFKAGASHYGVADLRALDADTHKFESHYSHRLIAPMPEREMLYEERSPIHHAHRMKCPVIFFQGLDDKVVPPSQSETMVAAMRARGVTAAYVSFPGEGHGFRKRESLQIALETEFSFYARVFGLTPSEPLPVLDLR